MDGTSFAGPGDGSWTMATVNPPHTEPIVPTVWGQPRKRRDPPHPPPGRSRATPIATAAMRAHLQSVIDVLGR